MSNERAPSFINRGGRPRLVRDCESITVSTRLPEPLHDKLKSVADRRGESVAQTLRRLVILTLKEG
jgi:hypothetical protein